MRALGVSVTAIFLGLVVYSAASLAFGAFGYRIDMTFPEWMTVGAVVWSFDIVHRAFDAE